MMAVVQTAMLGGLPYTALRDAIFTHPTAAEGLIGLFSNLPSAPRQDSHVSNRIEPRRRQATAVPVSAAHGTTLTDFGMVQFQGCKGKTCREHLAAAGLPGREPARAWLTFHSLKRIPAFSWLLLLRSGWSHGRLRPLPGEAGITPATKLINTNPKRKRESLACTSGWCEDLSCRGNIRPVLQHG